MPLTEPTQFTLPADVFDASLFAEREAVVVVLRGEADLATFPALTDVLARVIAYYDGPVVIDLAELAFIDSGSIRALATAAELLGGRGRELTLRSPSRMAVRMLTLLELSHLLTTPHGAERRHPCTSVSGPSC